ncbi:toxin-antitoxin system toxin component, PIN family protein, partial [Candidatus Woesearchaeota archaeon]|nr:toxin-antitoxin system toxin component, PIN family protein [Candidatus Woesearchaeota archaeon]
FISIILEIATIVEITGKVKVILEDQDDDAMLETAVVGNVDYLVSGDPHLLKLKEFTKVKIVTASEFLGV